jgi:UDP-N-acetylglucosamine 2-epimerase (non-hydrolysing)
MKKDILVVCGTRPEIIKMAPVYRALKASSRLNPVLLHTGQHTDLATPVYKFFGMEPDHTIELQRERPDLAHLSAILLEHCTDVIEAVKPSAVLVHGDTSSAAMAAMAAFYTQRAVGHVEAGLRTGDKYSPFPEEMNRSLIGRIAHWHWAPTERSREALRLENIPDSEILVTGNTVIDAAQMTAQMLKEGHADAFITQSNLAERIEGRRLVLVTAHRRENWGEGLRQIADAVCDLLTQYPDTFFVWPLHANPDVARTVREAVAARGIDTSRLMLTAPLDYTALIWILSRAWMTMTDSGGIQEEAAALGAPALVLRDSTERPELIEAGGGILTGAVRSVIVETVRKLESDTEALNKMRTIDNPFGDGTAATQIVAQLEAHFQPK